MQEGQIFRGAVPQRNVRPGSPRPASVRLRPVLHGPRSAAILLEAPCPKAWRAWARLGQPPSGRVRHSTGRFGGNSLHPRYRRAQNGSPRSASVRWGLAFHGPLWRQLSTLRGVSHRDPLPRRASRGFAQRRHPRAASAATLSWPGSASLRSAHLGSATHGPFRRQPLLSARSRLAGIGWPGLRCASPSRAHHGALRRQLFQPSRGYALLRTVPRRLAHHGPLRRRLFTLRCKARHRCAGLSFASLCTGRFGADFSRHATPGDAALRPAPRGRAIHGPLRRHLFAPGRPSAARCGPSPGSLRFGMVRSCAPRAASAATFRPVVPPRCVAGLGRARSGRPWHGRAWHSTGRFGGIFPGASTLRESSQRRASRGRATTGLALHGALRRQLSQRWASRRTAWWGHAPHGLPRHRQAHHGPLRRQLSLSLGQAFRGQAQRCQPASAAPRAASAASFLPSRRKSGRPCAT